MNSGVLPLCVLFYLPLIFLKDLIPDKTNYQTQTINYKL